MVRIVPPPPTVTPQPLFHAVPAGDQLVRIFDPTSRWGTGPLTFNYNGPRHRFDHHRPPPPGSAASCLDDPDHGIYYAAWSLSCCIAERFGDYLIIDKPHLHVAYLVVNRPLKLLDLCGNGAMRIGSVAGLCATPDRPLTQSWSRYFYEQSVFANCDGIRFHSAHNNEPAVALYERAANALDMPVNSKPLSDPDRRSELQAIAFEQGQSLLI